MKIILFPVYFLIMIPIELDLWLEYRKTHRVHNYFKFVFYRAVGKNYLLKPTLTDEPSHEEQN